MRKSILRGLAEDLKGHLLSINSARGRMTSSGDHERARMTSTGSLDPLRPGDHERARLASTRSPDRSSPRRSRRSAPGAARWVAIIGASAGCASDVAFRSSGWSGPSRACARRSDAAVVPWPRGAGNYHPR